MFLGIAIAVWVVSGIAAYGSMVYEYKARFAYFPVPTSLKFMCLLGPCSLFGFLMAHEGKYGVSFRPYTREERYRNFNSIFPTLCYTREQFDKEY